MCCRQYKEAAALGANIRFVQSDSDTVLNTSEMPNPGRGKRSYKQLLSQLLMLLTANPNALHGLRPVLIVQGAGRRRDALAKASNP